MCIPVRWRLTVNLGVLFLLLHVLLLPAAVDEDLLHDVAPQLLVEGEHHDHEAEKWKVVVNIGILLYPRY